jgi:hypothetical protein
VTTTREPRLLRQSGLFCLNRRNDEDEQQDGEREASHRSDHRDDGRWFASRVGLVALSIAATPASEKSSRSATDGSKAASPEQPPSSGPAALPRATPRAKPSGIASGALSIRSTWLVSAGGTPSAAREITGREKRLAGSRAASGGEGIEAALQGLSSAGMTDEERDQEGAEEPIEDLEAPAIADVVGGADIPTLTKPRACGNLRTCRTNTSCYNTGAAPVQAEAL